MSLLGRGRCLSELKEEDAEQGRESLRSQHRSNKGSAHSTWSLRSRHRSNEGLAHSMWSLRSRHRSNKGSAHSTWSLRSQHRSNKGSAHSTWSFRAQRPLTGEIPHFSVPQKEPGLPHHARHWLGAAEIDRSLSLKLQWMPEMLHLIALLPVESQAFEKKN